jgi:ribose transport system permease protein
VKKVRNSPPIAAYMSGVPIRRAKFLAYTLSGLLAAISEEPVA